MGEKFILALDQSTSGSKVAIVNKEGKILHKLAKNHKQIYPKPGWVEHNPMEIYAVCKELLNDVIIKSKIEISSISVLSITNQRETIVLWNKETGLPVYNAIVWQCRRTVELCDKYELTEKTELIMQKTGLKLNPYFSATKIKWIFDNVKETYEIAQKGNLCFGTIDTWLIWKLTGGKEYVTDYTNASRTLLFNINTLKWDDELLKIFNIKNLLLPEVKPSNSIFGYSKENELFKTRIPISGVIGDSQGALFGQQCIKPGMMKATFGTGTSVMMYTGDKLMHSKKGLISAVAWGIDKKVDYALEGIINCTGDTLKWVKDNLGLFKSYDDVEEIISNLDDNQGVYIVPAFTGLGVPYWNANAKAAIVGMTRGTAKEHIIRAAVESIAYQVNDAVNVIVEETKLNVESLRVDGGAAGNKFLMQLQSDILKIPVIISDTTELSLIGSVYLGGLGVGVWKSLKEINDLYESSKIFKPNLSEEVRKKYITGWNKAINKIVY